jgi:hypothetical protein
VEVELVFRVRTDAEEVEFYKKYDLLPAGPSGLPEVFPLQSTEFR